MQAKLIATVLAGVLTAGAAIAQLATPPATSDDKTTSVQSRADQRPVSLVALFKSADTDGDGALTKAEAQAGNLGQIAKHFDEIDTNHDGKITLDELRTAMRKLMPAVSI